MTDAAPWVAAGVFAVAAAALTVWALLGDDPPSPGAVPVVAVPVEIARLDQLRASASAPAAHGKETPAERPPPALIVTEPEPGYPASPDPAPPVSSAPVSSASVSAALAPIVSPPPPAPPSALAPSVLAPPWRANAVPAKIPAGRPVVAVVIDDMGLDRKRSARTVRLPGPLTLSWLPYAEDLPAQTAAAHAAGHELMLHLPMEPSVPANPGPDALLTSLDAAENLRRLDRAMERFTGFVGVNNHMGSRFTVDRTALRPILEQIQRRGYFWLDSRTAPNSQGMATAAELGMPWAGRDVFLDHVMFPAEVTKALARLETTAKQTGMAVAIGHPHDVTIDALTRWLPELSARGLTLVPMSAIIAARQAAGIGAMKAPPDVIPQTSPPLGRMGEAR